MTGVLKFMLAAGAFGALLGGCAAPVALEDPAVSLLAQCRAERDACQRAHDVCQIRLGRVSKNLVEQTKAEIAANKSLADTKAQLTACEARSAEMANEARLLKEKTSELAATREQLAQRLKDSIAKKDVEIELLRGRLSVRVLDRILFASGSAAIRPEGLEVLDKIAQVLVGGREKIRVEGHTDDVPISSALRSRYPTNWELSGARAASVVRYFQGKHEIVPTRLEAVGHSFYQGVAGNDSEQNRQRNRRVEVVLTASGASD